MGKSIDWGLSGMNVAVTNTIWACAPRRGYGLAIQKTKCVYDVYALCFSRPRGSFQAITSQDAEGFAAIDRPRDHQHPGSTAARSCCYSTDLAIRAP
jgi:hypothetical protein